MSLMVFAHALTVGVVIESVEWTGDVPFVELQAVVVLKFSRQFCS